MNKLLLVVIIVFCFPFSALADSDIVGFRDFKWGCSAKSMGELVEDHKEDGEAFFTKVGDNLNIGDARADKITYYFYKDKLELVVINFKGYDKYSYILKSLEKKYGDSEQPNEFMEKHVWYRTEGTAAIEYSEVDNHGEVMIYSKKVSQEQEADKEKSAQDKGAGDL